MYGAPIISFDEFMGAVQGICAFQFTNEKNEWRTLNLKKREDNFSSIVHIDGDTLIHLIRCVRGL